MPNVTLFEMDTIALGRVARFSPFDVKELSGMALQRLIEAATDEAIEIRLKNIEGQPFKIIAGAGGVMDWGVGGA